VKKTDNIGKALIIDQHTTYSLPLIRALARRGYVVEIFAEPHSPAVHSNFCQKSILSPDFREDKAAVSSAIGKVVQNGTYDVIYLCSEQVLPIILQIAPTADCWRALPLTEPSDLSVLISKHAVLKRVAEAGVPIPRTIFPIDESEVSAAGDDIGYPLLLKGDRGEGSQQVRLVKKSDFLLSEYSQLAAMGEDRKILPCLQEYLRGPKYTVAGLFDKGKPLRVMAYLSELSYPPTIGHTIKGVTENPPGLLGAAYKAFAALRFTGLGNLEWIKDARDGEYKFLEINPRVWGNFGFAECADVDLVTPYRQLAEGNHVEPDLRFKTGIHYRRWLNDLRLVAKRPGRFFGFVADSMKPMVFSDFSWGDLPAIFPIDYFMKRLIKKNSLQST